MERTVCTKCIQLREEYDNALKFEAVSYAKLIAHKRRHDAIEEHPRRMQHLRLVNEVARRHAEGDFETPREVSCAGEMNPADNSERK